MPLGIWKMACKLSVYVFIGVILVVKAVNADPTAKAAPQPAPVPEAPIADPESELTPHNPNNRAGSSIKCYDCVNCEKITSRQSAAYCPLSRDPRKNGKCVNYKMMTASGDFYFSRSCASKSGTCNELSKLSQTHRGLKLEYCHECTEDGCNAGTNLVASLVFLIVVPIFGCKILS